MAKSSKEKADPNRAKVRTDNELPNIVKSNTDKELPKRERE
jgi:hypothetical protein